MEFQIFLEEKIKKMTPATPAQIIALCNNIRNFYVQFLINEDLPSPHNHDEELIKYLKFIE